MNPKKMQFKQRIRNLAAKIDLPPNIVMENYMYERFLARLSKTKYKDNFVIKGGVLIQNLIGVRYRSTNDIDGSLIDFDFNEDSIKKMFLEIVDVKSDDCVEFKLFSIGQIMKNSDFDGLRVRLSTTYIDIETMIQIDVCKADKVVPNPIEYEIPSSIGDSKPFKIYGYSVSTVLAEKLHAILSLGGFTSRMKDYYDVYMLTKNNKYDKNEVRFAFKSILSERKDLSIYENKEDTLREIEKSDEIKISWQHYQIRYPYAANISFDDVFFVVKTLALSL